MNKNISKDKLLEQIRSEKMMGYLDSDDDTESLIDDLCYCEGCCKFIEGDTINYRGLCYECEEYRCIERNMNRVLDELLKKYKQK